MTTQRKITLSQAAECGAVGLVIYCGAGRAQFGGCFPHSRFLPAGPRRGALFYTQAGSVLRATISLIFAASASSSNGLVIKSMPCVRKSARTDACAA